MRTLPRLQTHIGDNRDPPDRIPPAQNLEDPVPTLHVFFSNRIPISLIISSFSAPARQTHFETLVKFFKALK